jgi:hypothetical protein
MKKVLFGAIFLFHQSLIFTMKLNQQKIVYDFFDEHKKTTDQYTQNVGKNLKANITAEFEKQKKLEKKQNNDQDLCQCIYSLI